MKPPPIPNARPLQTQAHQPGVESIMTPRLASPFPKEKVGSFATDVPMKRSGEPEEVAPCDVFPGSDDSSYMSGQVLHSNSGEFVYG